MLIYRLPLDKSIVWPGSRCPRCDTPLKARHNIPLISFIFLRGKCAFCDRPISFRYPAVELLTGILALGLWYSMGEQMLQGKWWQITYSTIQLLSLLILIPAAIIDLRHYIIPDSITIGGLLAGLTLSFIPGNPSPAEAFLGMTAGGGSLLCVGYMGEIIFRKKETMGGGDIKLMAFMGAFWGWQSALLGIVFASFLGAVAGIFLISSGTLRKDHHIPFGPFLAAGIWTAVLYGETILSSYFQLIDGLFYFS